MNKLLTIGSDIPLLETRASILSLKYKTELETYENALKRLRQEHFDLLMVCYSTPADRASIIINTAHAEFPHLCIVRLLSADSPPIDDPVAHRVVTIDYHPETWMRVVDELLTPGSSDQNVIH